jgi:hypothetical protein
MLVKLSTKQAIIVRKLLLLRRQELKKLENLFGNTILRKLEIRELHYIIKLFGENKK